MRPLRIASLVLGTLLAVPAIGLLLGGGSLALAYAFGRDDDGYFERSADGIASEAAAVTTDELDLAVDPGTPDQLLDTLDLDVRLAVTEAEGGQVFVGIAPAADLDTYLGGVAHDQILEFEDGSPVFRRQPGTADAPPPADQTFWTVSAAGPGTQEIEWEATAGRWAVVVMNADGRPGVSFDADVGARAGVVPTVIGALLAVGAVLTIGAVGLIVLGAVAPDGPTEGRTAADGQPVGQPVSGSPALPWPDHPVAVEAQLDPGLSRWQWLVKWLLAIPHVVVLVFLWLAVVVLTVVAGIAIVFTGRYPRRIFDFNVGVLRWSWRVSYYATTGGIGTDRYPPFTLAPVDDYPASLDVAYPEQLSRWLVLVKWWLLAIPHYVIIGVLAGGIGWPTYPDVVARDGLHLLHLGGDRDRDHGRGRRLG
ncbi:MAG: DUF4389 domain-containing protein, partial [Actinomycetota bacterium]